MSAVEHWPLFGLRVRTPRVELRYPTDDEVAEIAHRSVTDGVHDPAFMPFGFEWTDVDPPAQQRNSMQFHWSLRAGWTPDNWNCNFAVLVDGRIVGAQSAEAVRFATMRSVTTGSFLFLPEQGKGIGTEMRAAILHLVFEGLGAEYAHTGAWSDNERSLGVTRKLGYEFEGQRRMISRGKPRNMMGYRLGRDRWLEHRRDDIVVEGLEPCLEMFGAPTRLGCAGVDGCKSGWVVATRAGVRVVADIADVFGAGHTVVGIDMPIGLPDTDNRSADRLARRFLSPRGSTIFPTPPRVCLGARTYAEASELSAAATGKKLTQQTWNIVAKMRAVDAALDPSDEQRIIEVHPECSFAVMNGDKALPTKHSADGLERRAAFIEAEFGPVASRLPGASFDDILDAYAALWTAERFARGVHREMPDGRNERDARGLLMRICA
ncbi:MAG: putative succinyl-CoA transferase [Ilumatobacteraceae bacterium]|nr:putative succinyl-CoA transferase [Ilumatobacteraceae bacterium]